MSRRSAARLCRLLRLLRRYGYRIAERGAVAVFVRRRFFRRRPPMRTRASFAAPAITRMLSFPRPRQKEFGATAAEHNGAWTRIPRAMSAHALNAHAHTHAAFSRFADETQTNAGFTVAQWRRKCAAPQEQYARFAV